MRRSSPACSKHLTSLSRAKQRPCNPRKFVVGSLVVLAHGEIQADVTAAHPGSTAQAPPLNKTFRNRGLCSSKKDFRWDDALGISQSFVVAIVARPTSWGFAAEQQ